MKIFRSVMFAAAVCLSFVSAAKADPFNTISFTYQLSSNDVTEKGRPSRNGVPQTYAGNETYPGVLASTVNNTYYYKTFTFASSLFAGAPYIDVSTYDPTNGNSYFISAYQNFYDPNNRAANWLGDAGFSGNYQTNDGGAFSLTLPTSSSLVLVLTSTGGGAAVPTYPFTVNVQAYGDTSYGDPITAVAATPEPSSLILAGSGLLGMAGAFVRRRFAV